MGPIEKKRGQKGGVDLTSILVGALVMIAILAAIKYVHDRNNDVTIQLPRVEVH